MVLVYTVYGLSLFFIVKKDKIISLGEQYEQEIDSGSTAACITPDLIRLAKVATGKNRISVGTSCLDITRSDEQLRVRKRER